MPIRVTGLNSGLDTDSIIQELVSAYRSKGDKIKKNQTKLSWTQDKWKSLNAKVLNLYKSLDNLRFSSGYSLKKTTISDTTKATVTASKSAKNGTQTLKIKQTASGGYLTGASLSKNTRGSSATLSSLGFQGTGNYHIVGGNGVEANFEVTSTTKISDFIEQINNSGTGVTASYDEANKRLFISSTTTGKNGDFTLTGTDQKGMEALKALGVNVASAATSSAEAGAWAKYYDSTGLRSDLLEADILKLAEAKKNQERYEKDIKNTEERNTLLTKAVNYVNALEGKNAAEAKFGGDVNATSLAQLVTMSDADLDLEYIVEADGTLTLADDTKPGRVKGRDLLNQLAPNFEKTETVKDKDGNDVEVETEEYKLLKAYNNNKAIVTELGKDPDVVTQAGRGVDALVEEIGQNDNLILDIRDKYNLEAETLKEYSVLNSDKLTKDIDSAAKAQQYIADLNLGDKAKFFYDNYEPKVLDDGTVQYQLKAGNVSEGASKVDGKDAEIYLNGAYFTSDTNTFNINGLTIQAQAVTGMNDSDAITITTATDTQGIYDTIKDFISEYNSIINEMSSLYNADSSRGYEPLTSEEKSALSESEVADWEKKIKDSLLRRDSNLSTLMTAMTSAMSSVFKVNGKNYSLASLGIKTGSYFNTTAATRYMYHIDGDKDDDTTAANEDQLMAMLNSDPDTVIEIIKGAANALNKNLGDQMKPSTLRSYQSIYNDKAMAQSYSDYTKKISAWEEKVAAIEDSYYKKFAAMETALAKLQSQQSAFAGMLGS